MFRARPPRLTKRQRVKLTFMLVLAAAALATLTLGLRVWRMTCETALSDARDSVNIAVNNAINSIMSSEKWFGASFVTLEHDAGGAVSAITTDVSAVNALSSQLMAELAQTASSGGLDVNVPLGDILGMGAFTGRGPKMQVRVTMLTSSYATYRSELVSAGINQTLHRIALQVTVFAQIYIPWAHISAEIDNEVLIAETVIVGSVPETYLNME